MLMIGSLEINEAGKGSVILNKMNQRRHKTPAHLSSVPTRDFSSFWYTGSRGRYIYSDMWPLGSNKQIGTRKRQASHSGHVVLINHQLSKCRDWPFRTPVCVSGHSSSLARHLQSEANL